MKAKAFLQQYKEALIKTEILKDKIKHLENAILTAAQFDRTPKPTYKDSKTEKTAVKLAILKEKYKRQLLEAELISQNISDLILKIPNIKYQTLLYYRYIKFYKWVDVSEVLATRFNRKYDEKYIITEMNGRALEEMQKILDERNI